MQAGGQRKMQQFRVDQASSETISEQQRHGQLQPTAPQAGRSARPRRRPGAARAGHAEPGACARSRPPTRAARRETVARAPASRRFSRSSSSYGRLPTPRHHAGAGHDHGHAQPEDDVSRGRGGPGAAPRRAAPSHARPARPAGGPSRSALPAHHTCSSRSPRASLVRRPPAPPSFAAAGGQPCSRLQWPAGSILGQFTGSTAG